MTDDRTHLFEEHLLLGASMEEFGETGILVPSAYPDESLDTDSNATCLCDLTGLPYALVSGHDAQALIEMSCAGKRLEVGECAFEAVLFGDGRLVGTPMVLRTGEHEYCLLDLSADNDACMEWILGLSGLQQGNVRVFDDVKVEDATDMLVPLLLCGCEATAVLGDYLSLDETLPLPGKVKSLFLDRIQALLACVPSYDGSYIVLVPPARARVLWRSFLSFMSVRPMGLVGFKRRLGDALPWFGHIDSDVPQNAAVLSTYGLIRPDGQFVGMRGLLEG